MMASSAVGNRPMFRRALFAVVLLVSVQPVHADEPLVDRVRSSIERGVRYLRREEKGRGNWEPSQVANDKPGGSTTLALLALLNSGVPVDDPMIQRGLGFLRAL